MEKYMTFGTRKLAAVVVLLVILGGASTTSPHNTTTSSHDVGGNFGLGDDPLAWLSPGLSLIGGAPGIIWKETDASANNQLWDQYADNGVMHFRALGDNLSSTEWLRVTRNGTTISSLLFTGAIVNFNGNLGVGASPRGIHASGITMSGMFPGLAFIETDAAADNGLWDAYVEGGVLKFRVVADGLGSEKTWLQVTRSGTAVSSVNFPSGNLNVTNDLSVSGNIAAKYQDVAEWVRTSQRLSAGAVVTIDPGAPDRVLAASQPYDSRVAGVVSLKPGLLLGEAGDGKVMVSHNGRVRVKADARYSPIAIGDLLVTSATPGHAMRSTPVDVGGAQIHRPGTILGKALEPLTEGQGEILVLLTLQ